MKKPIGYWIKKADEHLTNGINDIQSAYNLTRTEWQVLNFISEGNAVAKHEIVAIMHPFADTQSVGKILSKFSSAGLIRTPESDVFSLSQDGKTLHAACFNKQREFRSKTMEGISDEEYETTIATLQKMIGNITRNVNSGQRPVGNEK